jgi:hypothetical protein
MQNAKRAKVDGTALTDGLRIRRRLAHPQNIRASSAIADDGSGLLTHTQIALVVFGPAGDVALAQPQPDKRVMETMACGQYSSARN